MISIVIVNYNGLKYIKKCIDSLLEQEYRDFEIIFVDNGSSDGSIEFVRNNYSDIKIVISKKNLGFAGGNNLGIKSAQGDLIMLLNNDTWVDRDFLSRLTEFYNKNNYDVVAPLENNYDNSNRPVYITKIDILGHPIYQFMTTKSIKQSDSFYLAGVCLLFNKKLYQNTDGLDNNFFMYFEEVDWFWRLHLYGKKICYINNLYVHHFGSATTSNGEKIKYLSFLWRNQNTLQMLLKNYKLYNLVWILPMYFVQNLVEIIFFLVLLRPKIAFTYVLGWTFNIRNINKIIKNRKIIQKNRLVSDIFIFKKMYFGSAKLTHLLNFYATKQ